MSENHALSLALAARLMAAVRLPGGLVITESVSLKPLWRAGITGCLVIALAACGGAGADSGNPDPAQSSVVSAPADGAGAQTPAVPVGLAATSGDSQIALGWTASAGAASYNVKRSTTSGGPYTIIASPISPSYTDTALTNGDTYYYVVSAVNSAGESPNSSQVQGTPAAAAQPPAAPTGLVATAGETQVALAWAASADAAGYRVKRGTSSGGPYTTIASPTTSSYTDTGLTNGTTYYYVVSATNSAGESPDSSEARATPAAAVRPPSAPTGLIATGGNAQIALTWSGSASATSYHVKRATTSGGPYTTVSSPTGASYTDTGLMNGTTYYYVISAVNSAGESANSSEARATPSAPLPVPGTPTGLAATAGDARVSLTWSASANA